MSAKQINLSEMEVGERGKLVDGTPVELRDNGKAGGCETDLWLALVEQDENDLPTIRIDTHEVSV